MLPTGAAATLASNIRRFIRQAWRLHKPRQFQSKARPAWVNPVLL
jgi:hypothetical protein